MDHSLCYGLFPAQAIHVEPTGQDIEDDVRGRRRLPTDATSQSYLTPGTIFLGRPRSNVLSSQYIG
jgi:hypothetical protein